MTKTDKILNMVSGLVSCGILTVFFFGMIASVTVITISVGFSSFFWCITALVRVSKKSTNTLGNIVFQKKTGITTLEDQKIKKK